MLSVNGQKGHACRPSKTTLAFQPFGLRAESRRIILDPGLLTTRNTWILEWRSLPDRLTPLEPPGLLCTWDQTTILSCWVSRRCLGGRLLGAPLRSRRDDQSAKPVNAASLSPLVSSKYPASRCPRGKTAPGRLKRFGISLSTSIVRVPRLGAFVLNEIAPYSKDFELVSATSPPNLAAAGGNCRLTTAADVPGGWNRPMRGQATAVERCIGEDVPLARARIRTRLGCSTKR